MQKVSSTTTELALRHYAVKRIPWTVVARILGQRVGDIYGAVRVLGIADEAKRHQKLARLASLKPIVMRMEHGENLRVIAASMGIQFMTLYKRLERAGLPTSVAAARNKT